MVVLNLVHHLEDRLLVELEELILEEVAVVVEVIVMLVELEDQE
jgi:hypothetical protein